jgi:hypothetical protein
MNTAPTAAPARVCHQPRIAPSTRSAPLAESMKPAAMAFATPIQRRSNLPNANGSAPSPVASAVASAASVTARRRTYGP